MKAFPTAADNGHSQNQDGMDLRDYFAAKAMQGNIAASPADTFLDVKVCAKWAYEMADAMLKARDKNDPRG